MNIILLISDTFRYDNLFDRAAKCPGGIPARTPNLDAFAERAVSASRMYTSSFPTIPHRTDLTTGRYGWPWYPWQSRLMSGPNHIPDILRRAGYVSQLLCDCPHLFGANFHHGFNGAYTLRGQEGDTYFLRMNHPITHVMPPEKTRSGSHFGGHNLPDLAGWTNARWYREEDRFPPRTAALAVEWLEENYKHHPFFLWVDFFDPHEPWDPPEYMVRRYDPDYAGTPMIHPNYGKADDYTPAELRNLRAHYCAEAELVDRWVSRVIQKIDDLGLWDNSIVIFTTDHGMSLGEHNRTGKSNINDRDNRCWPIYPEIAHIPFMIAAPNLEGGREIDEIVQPPDILPTLLDLAGIKAEPQQPFHGKSFAPLLCGQPREPLHEFAIAASFLRADRAQSISTKPVTPVVYTKRWAYGPIGPQGERELFDLKADPYCENNIAADHPDVVKDLHGKLTGWLREIDAPKEAISPFK
jgi:arylsulfatase A-like enzyme